MTKVLSGSDGPLFGLESSGDVYEKPKYESSRLCQGWGTYDAFIRRRRFVSSQIRGLVPESPVFIESVGLTRASRLYSLQVCPLCGLRAPETYW